MAWKRIDERLWCLEGLLPLGGGVVFPVRSVAAVLDDGTVWLCSPIEMSPEDRTALAELGPVRHLVAPNALHHLFFGDAMAAFPEAATWAPATLPAKRPDLRFDHVLGRDHAPWQAELERVAIDGAPWIDEHVFLHRASRSLLVTDLVFHITEPPAMMTNVVLWVAGVGRSLGQSRVYRLAVRERHATAASFRAVLDLSFDRIVMAHGTIVETNAREGMVRALAWLVPATAPSQN